MSTKKIAKKKTIIDVIPAHTNVSEKRYLYLIKKYGSGVVNSGTNLIILNEK